MSQTSFGPDGNIISVNEFLQNLYGELPEFFKDEDELIKIWGDPKTRKSFWIVYPIKDFLRNS